MRQNVKEEPHYPGPEKKERMLYNLADRSRGVKRLPEIIPQGQIWDSPPELLITSRFPFPSLGCVPRGMAEFSSEFQGWPRQRELAGAVEHFSSPIHFLRLYFGFLLGLWRSGFISPYLFNDMVLRMLGQYFCLPLFCINVTTCHQVLFCLGQFCS